MAEMDQIGTAARIGGIEMTHLEAEVIDHRHRPAGGITGAKITVDIGFGQPCVFDRTLGDLGVQLRGGFIGCVPGRMLIDPGNVGFALDGQIVLRWRFLFPAVFLACKGGLGKRRNIPWGETGATPRSRGTIAPEFASAWRLLDRGRRESRVHAAPAVSRANR